MPIVVGYTGKDYEPAPEGLWPAVCVDVVELGEQPNHYGGPPRDMLRVHWEISEMDDTRDGDPVPFQVVRRYTASLHPKSNLSKDLERWRGKPFTEEERQGFDVEKLIGANCQILVAHNHVDGGKTYANVQAITPAKSGQPKMAPSPDYTRFKDREQQSGNGDNGNPQHTEDEDIPF